jgi:hypothetical protein
MTGLVSHNKNNDTEQKDATNLHIQSKTDVAPITFFEWLAAGDEEQVNKNPISSRVADILVDQLILFGRQADIGHNDESVGTIENSCHVLIQILFH